MPEAPSRLRRLAGRPTLGGLALSAVALALLLARPAADAAKPSYNDPLGSAGIDTCVQPRETRGIRAYALDGTILPFTVATGHEPGTRPRCRTGELRILRLQALTIGGQRAYVRRGGCQQPCRVRQPTVHILARDLARPVALLPLTARRGDGSPAPGCTRTAHDAPARVGGDLGLMFYKTPADLHATHRRTGEIGAGARWSNYGDPGRRYGSPGHPAADYNYLLWNLPRRARGGLLPGGGIVEAVIEQGEPIALCTVPHLSLPSFDRRGAPDGTVVFGYARVSSGAPAPPIYGWILLGYSYRGRPFQAAVTTQ